MSTPKLIPALVASSISFRRSVKYGFGVLKTSADVGLKRPCFGDARYLRRDGRKLPSSVES